ncbi:hypothetical protein [Aminobacter aminovorans]|uniref:Uncharacterized protein n=1 Tax=Aminobacter aminovorans TaxID=83263 RepID=A0AAC8YLC9_AMIAI|nr:hypothetical protein [Aminobacter aminovorans]AMS40505.1 hypothetical protein AA2016_1573 [Aminobacter aminovorans]MBB3706563.1 hypothetical protein [Aminobacter aminovorans]
MATGNGFMDMLNGVNAGPFPPAPGLGGQPSGGLLGILSNLFRGPQNTGQFAQTPGDGPGLGPDSFPPPAHGLQAQTPRSGFARLLDTDIALPVAGALMGNQGNAANFGNAFSAAAPAIKRNKTLEYLQQNDPELARLVDMGLDVKDAFAIRLERQRAAQKPQGTSDMQEYEVAKQQGFKGTFMDYQIQMKEAGRNQVNIDTGVKLPSGFRWKDPKNQDLGVEPIPGGPGEQVPAELAARVGLADNFLSQLPQIREQVTAGAVTGPIDRALSGSGLGDGANTFRQIESGADALQRMLTGAGMPASEAAEYARRYKPTYADDAASLTQKLDQLEAELNSAKAMAMRGRGPEAAPQTGVSTTSTGATWRVK